MSNCPEFKFLFEKYENLQENLEYYRKEIKELEKTNTILSEQIKATREEKINLPPIQVLRLIVKDIASIMFSEGKHMFAKDTLGNYANRILFITKFREYFKENNETSSYISLSEAKHFMEEVYNNPQKFGL